MSLDDYSFEFYEEESRREPYPDYFYVWDKQLSENRIPGFFEVEELKDIIEIYLQQDELTKARQSIRIVLDKYGEDEDVLYDIFVLLSDFELWNDLLSLSKDLGKKQAFWIDGHKIEALFHLGMEEEAFQAFRQAKKRYAEDREALFILYRAVGESLIDIDLFEGAALVVEEGIDLLGDDIEFTWLQLESHVALADTEEVLKLGKKITNAAPFDSFSWHRLGLCYMEVKEYEKAIEAFEFAEDLNFPEKKKNLLKLIKAYEQNENHAKALDTAKEFLRLYPDAFFVNLTAASLSADMEKWEDAIKYLDEVIKVKPQIHVLYLYKSSYLMNLGEHRKALLILQEGIVKSEDPEGALKDELDRLKGQFPEIEI
ncbi:tetratricopeptide repeat protein [Bacteroidales bacterium OttesenSCG-928-J19]|nr:tetratricopeptide repeat protein [Bacteroidales bacterium OttesenSCG-928-J19]